MAFANIIKELRLKAGMTQDELAETLGITSQAISRWENGAATPDVPTITRLAYMFRVTSDYLLDIDSAHAELEIDEVLEKVWGMEKREAVETLHVLTQKYPRHTRIMQVQRFFLHALFQIEREEGNEKAARRHLSEALKLAEYLLEHAKTIKERSRAIYDILPLYKDAGRKKQAQQLLEELTDYSTVREKAIIELYDGEEKMKLMQENLYSLIAQVEWETYMLSLEDMIPREEKIRMLENAFHVAETAMPEDNPWFYSWQPTHIPWQLAKHYSMLGKTEDAIRWLEVMRDTALKDEFSGEQKFRMGSPLFTGFELKRYGHSWGAAWVLDVMGDDYFDNIRNDPRFAEIQRQLQNV
ncbi:MAG: helix-turn-helix domain-containing protein [Clostridia bacterium]|nr:helix-turn-helix domain-containing protein [Clostridia bacterium]